MAYFLYLVTLFFPVGLWLGLEGYEIASMICLIIGWYPVAITVGVYLHDRQVKQNATNK